MSVQIHRYRGKCYCGSVSVEVIGEPVFAAHCHCRSCRKWHSAPLAALSAWPETSVRVEGKTLQSVHSDKTLRTSCAKCGGGVLTRKPELGLHVVYPMTLSDSDFAFKPAFHIFYAERVMDIDDGPPKFADVPADAGGSGAVIDTPDETGWRL